MLINPVPFYITMYVDCVGSIKPPQFRERKSRDPFCDNVALNFGKKYKVKIVYLIHFVFFLPNSNVKHKGIANGKI